MLTLKREMQKGIAILIGACRVQRYFNSGRSGIEALGSARGFGYIETVRRIKFSFRRGGDTNKQTKKPPKVAGVPGRPPRLGRRRVPLCSAHQKASCSSVPRCKLKAFVGLCYYYLISFPCLPPLPSSPPSPRLARLHHVY